MENASQALLIAAGVLIGIIILSLAVYLFNTFGSFAEDTQKKIDANAIAQFNNKFLKYAGQTNLTIQDIITVKNYALENNKEDMFYKATQAEYRAAENNEYIDVFYADTKSNAYNLSALILAKDDETLLKEEMEKIKAGKESERFTCEVITNTITGRVSKIYFYEN